ncbi:MAG: hypothetical protein DVB25_03890 [Verrucomicrobia bacterium]|nr:MAG: hypothetical protein DVB25_03890 [Verrucomicrobiota bacterium]
MNFIKKRPLFLTILLLSIRLQAAEPSATPTSNEQIHQQLVEMQHSIRDMQTRHQAELDALKKQITEQQTLIDSLKPATPVAATHQTATPDPTPAFPTSDPSIVPASASVLPPGKRAVATPQVPAGSFPTSDASVVANVTASGPSADVLPPAGLAGGGAPKGSYLNISFDAVVVGAASTTPNLNTLEVGDHDPQQRGFNARNVELALDGAVDPFFEGFANIVFKLDNNNQTQVEVEEAFGQTTNLPYGLQMKAGQFFTQFGRINPNHPHSWDFVDAPLVQGLLLGPDGLRGVGAQLAWVIPVPFYAQAIVALQNGQGGTGYSFRNPGDTGTFFERTTINRQTDGITDLVITPRLEASVDLTSTQTLLGGVSAALGPNDTGYRSATQIYGVDLFYKWKPADAEGGWPFVKWQSEAMVRRFEAGQGLDNLYPVGETFRDWGAYSQVVWGFYKGWAAGLRGDYMHMQTSDVTNDAQRQSRSRISTDLTWYPSEFSKFRLQYNFDMLQSNAFLPSRDENSVFLLYEIALGAHGAHKF